MTKADAEQILARFEANLFRDLYQSRWDPVHAAAVVPLLKQCLAVDDIALLRRTLSALRRIGPEAHEAEGEVLRLLSHEQPVVRETAAWVLGGICLRQPAAVISPLMAAAEEPAMLKAVLFTLIDFGPAAKRAIPLFMRTFGSSDGRLRRLAIRGLEAIEADFSQVHSVLEKALQDRSAAVRRSAEKLLKRRWPERLRLVRRGGA